MLSRTVRLLGDRPFLVTDTQTLTYAEFDRRASRLANVLASLGVRKGEPVGLYLPSSPLLVTGYWACQKLGAIPAPMSVMYRDTEIIGIVSRAGIGVMLTDPSTFAFAQAAQKQLPGLKHLLVGGGQAEGGLPLEPLMAQAPDPPKEAMHSQLSQHSALRDMFVYNRFRWGREVLLDVLPVFNRVRCISSPKCRSAPPARFSSASCVDASLSSCCCP
jgi:long-chain acyl-CoA synthetase